ncbi:acyl-homoserine-lactone synthase [Tranquillimonas alkanivorans]|uniref:acyl-homoserine-lactone synthase n=1 Tax=Tranquillimonas alkanivorans TaxID=441119 RepID=A0A1I5Q7G0_9RHOB|nr:N-acyl-L-homoserine lactone synthetase [Tranquillimonas alkanivorans]
MRQDVIRNSGHEAVTAAVPKGAASPDRDRARANVLPQGGESADPTRKNKRTEGELSTAILSFENLHLHGELFVKFLKARREAFIVKNDWDLSEVSGMEYDQYDTPASRWIVVHQDGEVLAGIRLTPSTTYCGIYTYMIRDAQRGLLDSIPPNLLDFEAPVEPDVWESSRVFVVGDVPAALRMRVQAMMMQGMIEAARQSGGRVILGLVPAVWSRWIGRLKLHAVPAGPVIDIDGWKTQVAMMTLDATAEEAAAIESRLRRQPVPGAARAAGSRHDALT